MIFFSFTEEPIANIFHNNWKFHVCVCMVVYLIGFHPNGYKDWWSASDIPFGSEQKMLVGLFVLN